MKQLLCLSILLLSCHVWAQRGGAGNDNDQGGSGNAAPQISAANYIGQAISSIDAEKLSARADLKQFSYNPLISVNTNRGSLSTHFSIPVPVSLNLLKELRFSYSSERYEDEGYGVGFRIELPKIERVPYRDRKNNFRVIGPLDNSELVEVSEDHSLLAARIKKLSLAAFNTASSDLKFFRPVVDEGFNLYAQIGESGFLALQINGAAWAFNQDGLVVSYFDSYLNAINFAWEEGQIKEIKEKNNRWLVSFRYNDEELLPKWLNNRFVVPKKRLEKVLYQLPTQGTRVLNFSYQDQYLSKVTWSDGLLPVFEASYQSLVSSWGERETIETPTKEERLVFSDRDRPTKVKTQNDGKIYWYIDLNGDARQDRLVFDQAMFNQSLREIYSSIEYGEPPVNGECEVRPTIGPEQLRQAIEQAIPKLDVEMAHVEDNIFSYEKDESLSDISLKPLSVNISVTTEVQRNCKVHIYNVDIKENAFHFLDYDGNGRQDIVACGPNSFQEKNDFAKAIIKRDQEAFKKDGAPAKIFFQGLDQDKFSARVAELDRNMQAAYGPSVLLGVSKWEVHNASFNCHESSVFNDFNNDGSIDTLTSNTLYLNGVSDSKKIELDFEEAIRKFEVVDDDLSNDNSFLVADIDQDGVFEVVNANQILSRPVNSDTIVISDGAQRRLTPASRVKKISKFIAPFGGEVKVAYRFLSGRWVVSAIVHDSKTASQPIKTIDYEYEGQIHEPYRHLFVGFLKTREKKSVNHSGVAGTTISREFYADLTPAVTVFESRARLNGRLRYEDAQDTLGQVKLYSTEYSLDAKELTSKRLHPYIAQKTHSLFDPNGRYILNQEISTSRYTSWGNNLLPAGKESTRGSSWGILSLDSLEGLLNYSNESIQYSFNPAMYLQSPIRTVRKDARDQIVKVDDFLFNNFGQVESYRVGTRETRYQYDNSGRLIKMNSNRNGPILLEYHDQTQVPARITQVSADTRIASFDELRGKAKQYQSQNKTFADKFSVDGILISREKRTESGSWAELYRLGDINFENGEILQQINDQELRVHLDGFGNAINGFYDFADLSIETGSAVTIDGLVLSKEKPSSGGRRTHVSTFRYRYDALGRMTSLLKDGLESIQETHDYSGSCRLTRINGVATHSECLNTDDQKVKELYRGEEFNFEYDSLGQLNAVSNVGLKYSHDIHGQLVYSEGKNFEREETTYGPEGRVVSNQDGDKFYDQAERLKSFIPKSTENALEVHNLFDKALLKKRELKSANSLTFDYEHDMEDRLRKVNFAGRTLEYRYDQFDRVISERIEGNELQYDYSNGALISVKPYVRKVEYLPTSQISSILFENGLELNLFYDEHDRLVSRQYIRNGQSVWSERVEINSQGLISRINDSSIEYDNNLIPALNEGRVRSRRNQRGQVESLNGEELNWVGDNLYSVDGESNYYDENGSLVASCPVGSSFGQNGCFTRYQPDYISFAGKSVKLITVGGFKVGVLVNNQFYPLIENYLGSVVGILSQDGAEFLVERSYSAWGLRKAKTHNELGKELDRLVVWSFAGLFTNPVLDFELDIYWSNSRVYSPKLQQWLSIDPLVKHGPYSLLKIPGNWHGERYANNDPVNFVDPSGNIAMRLGVGGEASNIVGLSIERGIAVAFSMNKGLSIDVYKEIQVTAGWQSGAKIDSSLKFSNADHVNDLEGHSVGVKVEVATGLGGGASFSRGVDKNGNTTRIKEVGLNANAGIEISISGGFGETKLDRNEKLKDWADSFNKFWGFAHD